MVRSRYWYCADYALVMIPELSRKQMIDPVTLAVLKGRLEHITDKMNATLFRSPLIWLLPRPMMFRLGH